MGGGVLGARTITGNMDQYSLRVNKRSTVGVALNEIFLAWRKMQTLRDSVWLTIVCVFRLPTVWRPEIWRLRKTQGNETDEQTVFIYSCDRLHILFKMTNNSDSWTLNAPSAATHISQKTMFDGDPWCMCAILNHLGSNGSYILSIHI